MLSLLIASSAWARVAYHTNALPCHSARHGKRGMAVGAVRCLQERADRAPPKKTCTCLHHPSAILQMADALALDSRVALSRTTTRSITACAHLDMVESSGQLNAGKLQSIPGYRAMRWPTLANGLEQREQLRLHVGLGDVADKQLDGIGSTPWWRPALHALLWWGLQEVKQHCAAHRAMPCSHAWGQNKV